MKHNILTLVWIVLGCLVACSPEPQQQVLMGEEASPSMINTPANVIFANPSGNVVSSAAHGILDARLRAEIHAENQRGKLILQEKGTTYSLQLDMAAKKLTLAIDGQEVSDARTYAAAQQKFDFLIEHSAGLANEMAQSGTEMGCSPGQLGPFTANGASTSQSMAMQFAEIEKENNLENFTCGPAGRCGPFPCAFTVSTNLQVLNTGPWFPDVYLYTIEYCVGCCFIC